jgi:hypothetical protein
MRGKRDSRVAADMAEVAGQLARWRRSRSPGERIPETLWNSAAELAGRYGLTRTAKTLGLGYASLSERVRRKGAERNNGRVSSARPAFMELMPALLSGPCQCVIDFERADGSRLRMELSGCGTAELAALGRSFWGSP